MTMQQLLWQGTEKLNRSSVPDAGLDARYLLLEAFGESLASFLAIKDKTLPEDEETFLKCRKGRSAVGRVHRIWLHCNQSGPYGWFPGCDGP